MIVSKHAKASHLPINPLSIYPTHALLLVLVLLLTSLPSTSKCVAFASTLTTFPSPLIP